jgi:hypothetical protein
MKACWNSEPTKRPTLKILENTISEWLSCLNRNETVGGIGYAKYFENTASISNIQSLNIIVEFSKVVQRQTNTSIIQPHPQASYKSCLIKKVNEEVIEEVIETLEQNVEAVISSESNYISLKSDECLECKIIT